MPIGGKYSENLMLNKLSISDQYIVLFLSEPEYMGLGIKMIQHIVYCICDNQLIDIWLPILAILFLISTREMLPTDCTAKVQLNRKFCLPPGHFGALYAIEPISSAN